MVLTLPGIAGLVLTIGMAVDTNVIIFERIKEERRKGRPPYQAIQEGYKQAANTIFDANITTMITAIILYGIGYGPVKDRRCDYWQLVCIGRAFLAQAQVNLPACKYSHRHLEQGLQFDRLVSHDSIIR